MSFFKFLTFLRYVATFFITKTNNNNNEQIIVHKSYITEKKNDFAMEKSFSLNITILSCNFNKLQEESFRTMQFNYL